MTTAADLPAIFERAKNAHQSGDFTAAAGLYDLILAVAPAHAETLYLRGLTDLQRGRYESGLSWFDQALAANPDHASAHVNRTAALIALRRFADALAGSDQALRLKPSSLSALNNRATALNKLGRYGEARETADRVLAVNGSDPQALVSRAEALLGLEDYADAISACDRVIAVDPRNTEAHVFRAVALNATQRWDEALAAADHVLAIRASYPEVRAMRGLILKKLKRYDEALADFDATIAGAPHIDWVSGEALHLAMRVCRWSNWDEMVARVLSAIDAGKPAAQPFTLLAIPASAAQLQKAAAVYFNETARLSQPAPKAPGGKIKVGYFSSDFHDDHPVANLLIALLEAHDRARFELIGFGFGGDPESPLRKRIAGAMDRLIDVAAMDNGDVVTLARELGLHIGVDLNGPTAGSRPQLFNQGVAPVQVNYLGYAGTQGSARYDYIVVDPVVAPPVLRPYFSEKFVTLPGCYLPAAPAAPITTRFSRADLGLPENGFVFCCFNGGLKITPDAFDVWMRLLAAIPGSVLWLSKDNAVATRNLRAEAARRGIAPERLHFAPRVSRADHLARHRNADLFLDTFYFNAHSTAIDALAAGLPVVTRLGATFASRVAASVLTAASLPELITSSSADYENLARSLATDPGRLVDLRSRLAERGRASPLFDNRRYARHLEAAYTQMWAAHAAGRQPADIVVAGDGG